MKRAFGVLALVVFLAVLALAVATKLRREGVVCGLMELTEIVACGEPTESRWR